MKKTTQILIVIIIVLLLTVVGFAIMRKKSYRPATISSDYLSPLTGQAPSNFSGARFVGVAPSDWPSSLPVLNIKITNLENVTTILNDYCQIFEIDDGDYPYAYGDVCDYIVFDDGAHVQVLMPETQIPTTLNVAANTNGAQQFLAGIYGENIASPSEKIQYLTCDYDCDVPESAAEINALYLPYYYNYDGVPIITRELVPNEISVLTGGDGQIFKAELDTRVIDYQATSDDYRLVSIDEAVHNINLGDGVLLDYFELNYDNSDELAITSNLTNIELTAVGLEYRTDDDCRTAVPMYRFGGTGYDPRGNKIDLEILTPAIRFTLAN